MMAGNGQDAGGMCPIQTPNPGLSGSVVSACKSTPSTGHDRYCIALGVEGALTGDQGGRVGEGVRPGSGVPSTFVCLHSYPPSRARKIP